MKCPVCKEGNVKKITHSPGPVGNFPGASVSPFFQDVYRHLDNPRKSCISNKYASRK